MVWGKCGETDDIGVYIACLLASCDASLPDKRDHDGCIQLNELVA